MSKKTLYGAISKVEELDDGTLKVWGIASTESEDSDGEIITAAAMKAALPDYMKFGAVREMHQAKAAGTALEVEVGDDGVTKICAHIVDSEAIKKVQKEVYKGFSIGGRVTHRDELKKTTITGLRLAEISLVDRPANPDAVITCFKADGIELDEPLAKGLYSVSRFADLLDGLGYLVSGAEYEKQFEQDDSPIPLQMREWLAQGAELLKAMAAEEVDELLASLQSAVKAAKTDDLAKAEGEANDLHKAGRRNSNTDQATLNQIMKLLKELGAEDTDDDEADKVAKAEQFGELTKKANDHDALLKACGAAGCAEGEIAADFVAKLGTERDTLAKRVKELEATPEPAKAALKALTKGDDLGGGTDDTPAPQVQNGDGSTNEVASLIKMVHSGRRIG
ncbi:HK97 family phage prohead protease [Chromobacterium haemolyticum]|uniref:HK97 family phage prohead protease n=1 Tax=Chromobacterium haemolyticum TaxID=394935 RepID=UPI00307D1CCE